MTFIIYFLICLLQSMSASLVLGNLSAPIITVVSTSYTSPPWKQ